MPSRRGRPHEGAELVEKLDDCSDEARSRLKVIFQTLAGELTVEQACQALGIGRSAFNKLRSQFIENAVELLEPKTPGRKKKILTPEQVENQRLREEIGILMPHLQKDRVQKK